MRPDQFFQKSLIPAGQVLTLIETLLGGGLRQKLLRSPSQYQRHDTWDLLHLVAVWSMGASDIERVRAERCLFDLVKGMAGGPSNRVLMVQLVTELDSGNLNRASQLRLAHKYTHDHDRWQDALGALRTLIGFHPGKRNEWLEAQRPSMLKLGRTPSAWRTYVRNAPWTLAIQQLGLKQGIPSKLRLEETFGSRPGRERLPELWFKHFGRAYDAAHDCEVSDPLALPHGVQVRSNGRGWLDVLAVSPVLAEFSAQEQAVLSAAPASAGVLKPQTQSFEVSWDDLAAGTEKAVVWRQSYRDGALAAASEHAQLRRSAQVQALRTKLLDALSPDERELFEEAVSGIIDTSKVSKPSTRRPAAKKSASVSGTALVTATGTPRVRKTRKA